MANIRARTATISCVARRFPFAPHTGFPPGDANRALNTLKSDEVQGAAVIQVRR
jgi:hypothetical protein